MRPSLRACLFAGVFVSAVASPAEAQSPPPAPEKIAVGDWQLSPLLEVRTRGEYRRDAPDLGGRDFFGRDVSGRVRDAWVVMERSRLGLGVERGAVKAQITLQDARAYGATRTLESFAPYEAYAELRGSTSRPTYLRLGRQAVVWGEGRLIGNADFAPAGRALDAARAHYALGNFDFEALAAILEPPAPLGAAFKDTTGPSTMGVQIYGVTAKWTIDPLLRVELFGLARIARSDGSELDGSRIAASRLAGERYTGSLRVSGEGKGWEYGAEGAYQAGNASAVGITGADLAAFAAHAHVAKTLDQLVLSPTLGVSGSYASGDDGKGAYKQFDPLLADPQRFHGQMDLFGWSNMAEIAGKVGIVPFTDATVSVEYRHIELAQGRGEWVGSYLNAVGSSSTPPSLTTFPALASNAPNSKNLGNEIDIGFGWRPWVPFELRAGWSGLLLGQAAKNVMFAHARGSVDLAQYAFLQGTLTMP